MVPRYAEVTSI